MRRSIQRIVEATGSVLAGVVGVMVEVSPEGAHSNISAWIALTGARHLPYWLLDKGADRIILVVALAILVINLLAFVASFREKSGKDIATEMRVTDLRINDALDDLMNDSRASFKQSDAPEIMQRGPMAGQRVQLRGEVAPAQVS